MHRILQYQSTQSPRINHYLFRYPAKFHPPVANKLVSIFSNPGEHVIDPFCGSGTLLVEAIVNERHAFGIDVDPIAVTVSKAKTNLYDPKRLNELHDFLNESVQRLMRPRRNYDILSKSDISIEQQIEEIHEHELFIPQIPNIDHWFKRYVVNDLAQLHKLIQSTDLEPVYSDLIWAVFASIIRNCSNADPVPVSGLEVTKHMRDKLARGRKVNPFELFVKSLDRAIRDTLMYLQYRPTTHQCDITLADATRLTTEHLPTFDSLITSPPYLSAVDYYRRHTLEMFWLGATNTREERLNLLPSYIGRARVPGKHVQNTTPDDLSPRVRQFYNDFLEVNREKANAFLHYFSSMTATFQNLAPKMRSPNSPVVVVIGANNFCHQRIPTPDLLIESLSDSLTLKERFVYDIRDRYMSYTRHNGADIGQEHVLVFHPQG